MLLTYPKDKIMSIDLKISAFNYLVHELYKWHLEYSNDSKTNDLSKLKVMKLVFFTSAISSDRNNAGLLSTFNNFSAMPYGHVESDVYSKMDNLIYYHFDDQCLSIKEKLDIDNIEIDKELKSSIVLAVKKLRLTNPDLINYKAFDLVDISHKWKSWKMMYSLARRNGRYSMKIPTEMIMTELKSFT
jgi:uncharacterized phage-associated protein